MKKILSFALISAIIFLSNWNYVFANSSDNSEKIIKNISTIHNGNIYKNKIDTVVWNISNNEKKLDILLLSLKSLESKISKLKDSKNKSTLISIVDYFIYKTNNSLEVLNKQEEENNIEETVEDNQETNETQEIVYTRAALYEGFTENYNDKKKTVLTGKETYVYNGSVVASIEELDAKEVIFTLESTDISNLKSVIKEVILYVEGRKILSINSSNIKIISPTVAELRFNKMNEFIIPKQQIEFRLAVIWQDIGFEKVWVYQDIIRITSVEFKEVEWIISQKQVNSLVFNDADSVEEFQLAPAIITGSTLVSLSDSTYAQFNLKADFWKNTQQASNSELRVKIEKLQFHLSESNGNGTYELVNANNSSQRVTWVKSWNILEFDLSTIDENVISKGNWEDFSIYITNNNDITVLLELNRDGIIYSLPAITWANNITNHFIKSLELGSRTY